MMIVAISKINNDALNSQFIIGSPFFIKSQATVEYIWTWEGALPSDYELNWSISMYSQCVPLLSFSFFLSSDCGRFLGTYSDSESTARVVDLSGRNRLFSLMMALAVE